MRARTLLILTVTALLSCGLTAFGQNLLTNGGFETSDFTGWTTTGNFEFTQVVSGPFYVYNGAQEGPHHAPLRPVGADGTLSQSFNGTDGAYYGVSFCLAGVGHDPRDLSVYWARG